ncbi:MAG TPA: prepilin-type N-terminal cleavage/methylation domain-containing protein [Chthoniobacterales bacterium]|nr:prepilin-type N-terminal cleavage/methylation domain-containing protein [Chthoniobacterales bacterium]
MRLNSRYEGGFSFTEIMVAMGIGAMVLAATVTTSISLQKSLAAVESYFYTHIQQVRIIDYLSRDVKRSVIVTTSTDQQTVTCIMPNYVIQTGDADAGAPGDPTANVGKRRVPTITHTANGAIVDYGPKKADGVISGVTGATSTLTSASSSFGTNIVNYIIRGDGIPVGTIANYASATTLTLASPAGTSARAASNVEFVIAGTTTVVYSVSGKSITRTENGVVTTIASSTDQLVQQTVNGVTTTDDQRNTEYAQINVTFLPIFNFNAAAGANLGQSEQHRQDLKRASTNVFARAYLRNKRRG